MRNILFWICLFVLFMAFAAQQASAFGRGAVTSRQRVVTRVQPVRQKVIVQQQAVYAQPFVQQQAVYAQPVVQQRVVQQRVYAQPVIAQPVIQSYCAPSAAVIQQQQAYPGCQSFFAP